MKNALRLALCSLPFAGSLAFGFEDFTLQMLKAAHEETSWRHEVYTAGTSARLWDTNCPIIQAPAATVRFNFTEVETSAFTEHVDLYMPGAGLSFRTVGGVNFGVSYARGYSESKVIVLTPFGGRHTELEGHTDNVGGYLTRQWDCGFRVGGTWSYSTGDLDLRARDVTVWEHELWSATAGIGYARAFGEKAFGRNVWVDISANGVFATRDQEEEWHFAGLVKVGHNLCPDFAIYGLINIFQFVDRSAYLGIPREFAGYRMFFDETWGEAGGGFQARLGSGFSFTGEVTTPVYDEDKITGFQVRSAVNWSF